MMPTEPIRSLQASIPGRPVPWARATSGADSRTGRPRRFTPTAQKAWGRLAADALAAHARWRHLDGEVAVTVTVRPDRVDVSAVSLHTDDKRRPRGLPGDIDNYAKAVLDALTESGVLADDRQVVSLEIHFDPGGGT